MNYISDLSDVGLFSRVTETVPFLETFTVFLISACVEVLVIQQGVKKLINRKVVNENLEVSVLRIGLLHTKLTTHLEQRAV